MYSTHTHACIHFRNPQTKKMKTENAYSWKARFFCLFLKIYLAELDLSCGMQAL